MIFVRYLISIINFHPIFNISQLISHPSYANFRAFVPISAKSHPTRNILHVVICAPAGAYIGCIKILCLGLNSKNWRRALTATMETPSIESVIKLDFFSSPRATRSTDCHTPYGYRFISFTIPLHAPNVDGI